MAPLIGGQSVVGEWDPSARLFTVRGWVPGPAGAAAVDLGDGVELEIDVAAPAVLTALTVEAPWAGDPRAVPARAMAVVERLLGPVRTEALLALAASDDLVTRQLGGRSRRQVGVDGGVVPDLGKVALADLHAAVDPDPVVRAAAGLEAALLRQRRDLLAAAPAALAAAVGSTADLVGALDLDDLADLSRDVLAALLDDAAHRLGSEAPPTVRRLVERLRAWPGRHRVAAAVPAAMAPMAAAPPDAAATRPSPVLQVDCAEVGAVSAGAVYGVRRSEFELEVRAPAAAVAAGWWARAHGPDGTPLAMAPLLDGGTARLLLPPADLRVARLDVTAAPAVPRPTPQREAFDLALAAGRDAARSERLDDTGAASFAWRRCAAHHEAAGDPMRAGQAAERASRTRIRSATEAHTSPPAARLLSDVVARG